jgi:hypothetical protein
MLGKGAPMNAWTHSRDPKDELRMLTVGEDAQLEPEEVGALWSFVHGDIMIGGIRQQLKRALGLCPRHTWGYFVVEVELWQYGPKPRGGHIPFDVGVLYQDLLEDMIAKISATHRTTRHGLHDVLTPMDKCRICGDLSQPGDATTPIGYAGSNAATLTAEAAELAFTTAWCVRTKDHWGEWVCPLCKDLVATPSGTSTGMLCRSHLAQVESISTEEAHAVAARLDDIRNRLHRSVESMTQGGQPATLADDAAVIETLGWFAGWRFPLDVTPD